jgi:alpha-N-arabinofuranosidase
VALTGLNSAEEKRLYASSTLDAATGEVILKLVNATATESRSMVDLSGAGHLKGGTLTVLQADSLLAENTFAAPDHVAPRTTAFAPAGTKFELTLPANSLTIVRVGLVR